MFVFFSSKFFFTLVKKIYASKKLEYGIRMFVFFFTSGVLMFSLLGDLSARRGLVKCFDTGAHSVHYVSDAHL